jgi:tetratricopeptide (TPR) repeat protein
MDPSNVAYAYWLSFYRWESLSRGANSEAGQIILSGDTRPIIARIADELAAARRICPTYGPPYALEGQLRLFVLKQSAGAELIRKGARLAPYDAPTCLVAGKLAAGEGKFDEAEALLARAVSLQPQYFHEVTELYLTEWKRPDLARSLAGNDYDRLDELAIAFAAVPAYRDQAQAIRDEAESALRRRLTTADATPQDEATLARIEHDRGKLESSVELYQRALGQDYQQIEWRLSLAHSLAELGKLDEAIHEVKIVLRLRPGETRATKLMEELVGRTQKSGATQARQ